MPRTETMLIALAASLAGGAAAGHDTGGHAADATKATRSIAIDMSDRLRFTPAEVSVRKGEVVRFVVSNTGKLEHEFVLGTLPELKQHAQMMQQHAGMAHDAPHMAHVPPGKARKLAWQFTESGEFYYGCLVPGHFEAGMLGRIVVR
jgi:uncharacterized cupredoxin-like copper-binding protein